MKQVSLNFLAVCLVLLLGGPLVAGGAVKVRVGDPGFPSAKIPFAEFDHTDFDYLLRRYVDHQGMVAYRAWSQCRSDRVLLYAYLLSLGEADVDSGSDKMAEIAFYINAYNALAIWGILLEYPTPSIQASNRKNADYRIFDDLEVCIGGEYFSLNGIENDCLRTLDEPRIHFALVCAACGCPRLRPGAYWSINVDSWMTENAIEFFSDPKRCQLCQTTGTLKVSPILEWYREDFGRTDSDVIATIFPYLPMGIKYWLCAHPHCSRISYLGYDWRLNDQFPQVSQKVRGMPYAVYAKVSPILRVLKGKESQDSFVDDFEAPEPVKTNAVRQSVDALEEPDPPMALSPVAEANELDMRRKPLLKVRKRKINLPAIPEPPVALVPRREG